MIDDTIKDGKTIAGGGVYATVGFRAYDPTVVLSQPYGLNAITLRLRRRNPGVMKP